MAILMPNIPQFIICFYGVLKAGAVAVFTPPGAEAEEVIRQLNDSGAKVLATITKLGNLAKQAKEQTKIQHIVFTNVGDYLLPHDQILFKLVREKQDGHRLGYPLETTCIVKPILYTYSGRSPK